MSLFSLEFSLIMGSTCTSTVGPLFCAVKATKWAYVCLLVSTDPGAAHVHYCLVARRLRGHSAVLAEVGCMRSMGLGRDCRKALVKLMWLLPMLVRIGVRSPVLGCTEGTMPSVLCTVQKARCECKLVRSVQMQIVLCSVWKAQHECKLVCSVQMPSALLCTDANVFTALHGRHSVNAKCFALYRCKPVHCS
eukprot:scaffold27038_cov29-Tisochrysis_lutea.AAC.2